MERGREVTFPALFCGLSLMHAETVGTRGTLRKTAKVPKLTT